MTDEPTPDEIAELVAHLETETDWSVEDWQFQAAMYDGPTLDLELDWSPDADIDHDGDGTRQIVRSVVDRYDGGDGATVSNVIAETLSRADDADEEDVRHALETLKQRGEVYEPDAGYLRVT